MEEVSNTVALLKRKDAMAYTTVVAAPEGASLGERYAAISSAVAIGELVRDRGGHSLVIIDDLACMVTVLPLNLPPMFLAQHVHHWRNPHKRLDTLCWVLVRHCRSIKAAPLSSKVAFLSQNWCIGVQVEVWESITKALATLGPVADVEGNKLEDSMDEEQLVEYEGMMVAASAAQRRR